MRISDLRTQLAAIHHGTPQVQVRIDQALRDIEQQLQALAGLGHQFHLEPGPPVELPEWPKTVFHVTSAPNGRVVRDLGELLELGPGWFSTLEAAQHADGIETQFAGRGGVKRRGGLTVTGPAADPAASRLEARRALDAQVEEFKRNKLTIATEFLDANG